MNLVCEDLATKAELQELKDQINKLLGTTSEGGEIDVLAAEELTGTIIGDQLDLAESAMQDIKLQTLGGADIGIVDDLVLAALAQGQAQFVKLKGKNVIAPLKFVTDTTKKTTLTLVQNKEIGKIATTGAKVSSASIAVLSSLVNIIASLGLNIATVKILGNRIDLNEKALQDWNRDYNNLINLNSRLKQDLNQTGSELQKAQGLIDQQQVDIQDLKSNLTNANDDITTLTDSLNDAFSKIQSLKQENTNLYTELTNFTGEVTEQIQELTISTVDLQSNLEIAETNFQQLFTTTENLAIELANLQGRTTVLEDVIFDLSLKNSVNIAEISLLKKEVAQGLDVANSKLKNLEAQIILANAKAKSALASGGGFPLTAQQQVASTQTATLELMNHLAENPFSQEQLQIETFQLNATNPFFSLFDTLLSQINLSSPNITEVQLDEIKSSIKDSVGEKMQEIGLDQVPGKITNIEQQTKPEKIESTVDKSICKKTQPGECIEQNVKKPLKDILDNVKDIVDNINLNINTVIGIFPDFGNDKCQEVLDCALEIKDFLEQAWSSTTEDKTINGINHLLLLHNAAMLSQDIKQTVPEIASLALPNINLSDYQGNQIDLNAELLDVIEPIPESIVTTETPLPLQQSLTSHNQIIQSANGAILAVSNAKQSSLESLEIIGSWTATIGNVLQQQGVIEANSFPWMMENLNLKTALNGFIGNYPVNQETIAEITTLASIGVAVIENANQAIAENSEFIAASEQLQQNLADFATQKQQIEEAEIAASQAPEIDRFDLIKLEPEEIGEANNASE